MLIQRFESHADPSVLIICLQHLRILCFIQCWTLVWFIVGPSCWFVVWIICSAHCFNRLCASSFVVDPSRPTRVAITWNRSCRWTWQSGLIVYTVSPFGFVVPFCFVVPTHWRLFSLDARWLGCSSVVIGLIPTCFLQGSRVVRWIHLCVRP